MAFLCETDEKTHERHVYNGAVVLNKFILYIIALDQCPTELHETIRVAIRNAKPLESLNVSEFNS